MLNSKKGQTLGLGILSAIFIMITGMLILNFIMPEITTARTSLNCSSAASISDGVKLLCLITDSVVPYWIIVIFGVIIGVITSRMTL